MDFEEQERNEFTLARCSVREEFCVNHISPPSSLETSLVDELGNYSAFINLFEIFFVV